MPKPGVPSLGGSAVAAAWLRERPYTLLACLFFAVLAVPFLSSQDSQWDNVFRRAAAHMLAGQDMHRIEDGYLYPPFMAFLSMPFVGLNRYIARLAWFAINVACTVVLWRLSWRLSGGGPLQGHGSVPAREHVICALGLACGLRYAIAAFVNQQTDLVIAALLMAGCSALVRESPLRAATWLGLGAAMKGPPLLWAAYFGWRGKWRPGLWLLAVALAANLVPNVVSTPPAGGTWLGEWTQRYVLLLAQPQHEPGTWGSAIIQNQSLAGAANRWLLTEWSWDGTEFEVHYVHRRPSPAVLKLIVSAASAALLLASLATIGRRSGRPPPQLAGDMPSDRAFECSVMLMVPLLLSPMSSKPHFAVVLLPAFCLARHAVMQRDVVSAALLGAAILLGLVSARDLAGRFLSPLMMWNGAVSGSTLLLLVGCATVLVRRRLGGTVRPAGVGRLPPLATEGRATS